MFVKKSIYRKCADENSIKFYIDKMRGGKFYKFYIDKISD